eukprot:CAMPEP_0117466540 /NCGR_PEP_ID=MMETSP0784-20121206/5194_1 /TAXON_ID=39447 /ORGANISM="" /LENGTH=508 /DNA_ID=CAMNT_0005260483 /DNA_START=57 /DNA_END=1580 /DNA_ORIENTATION=+
MVSFQGYGAAWTPKTRPTQWHSPYGASGGAGGGAFALPGAAQPGGFCRLELYVPIARCGLLIGKGGSMFKELQAEFGVALQVPRGGDPDGALTIVEGDAAAVEACHAKIAHAVHGELQVVNRIDAGSKNGGKGQYSDWKGKGDPSACKGKGKGEGKGDRFPRPRPQVAQHGEFDQRRADEGRIASATDQISLLGSFPHPVIGELRDSMNVGEEFSTIEVANIPPMCDELALYLLFGPFGAIYSARMMRAGPNSHQGIGHIRFASAQAAEYAISEMNGAKLQGATVPLQVNMYEESPVATATAVGPPQRTGASGEQTVRVELAIPLHRCGLLVGASGAVYKELTAKHGVALKVPRQTDPEGTLTEVSGTPEAVQACCAEISEKVKHECELVRSIEEGGAGGPDTPDQPFFAAEPPMPAHVETFGEVSGGDADNQMVQVQLSIPIRRCGLLIGKAGCVFKELQANFGVGLQVPHATEPDGTPTFVEGPVNAVEACLAEIGRKVKGEFTVV